MNKAKKVYKPGNVNERTNRYLYEIKNHEKVIYLPSMNKYASTGAPLSKGQYLFRYGYLARGIDGSNKDKRRKQ